MSIFDSNKNQEGRNFLKEKLSFKNPFNRSYASVSMTSGMQDKKEPHAPSNPAGEEGAKPIIPTGMWSKCQGCATIVYADDLEAHFWVCPKCGHHFRLPSDKRIAMIADEGTFVEFGKEIAGSNPLDFPGYEQKLEKARKATDMNDALITGHAEISGHKCILCVMDSRFMMGSMGAAVGDKMTAAVERATKERLPLLVFTASGGARMQEGMVSLMQMAKVSAALARMSDAGLLYLVVLTDPTTGGVTASFAMLGDITLAEPKALVGFAGKRVIEQTIRQKLPEGFQSAEFLLEKGFVDKIVPREQMKETLSTILALHERKGA